MQIDVLLNRFKRFTIIEPLAFALAFAIANSTNVTTDLFIYQTCKVILGLNVSDCDVLQDNSSSPHAKDIQKLVQPHAGSIIILKSCMETLIPAVVSLFLGPWSDQNGRKPLLFTVFTGYSLTFLSLALLSNFNVNPYWFLICILTTSITGGFPTAVTTFCCYTTDTTSDETRAWNMACLEASIFFGFVIGTVVGPIVFNRLGFAAVFSISALLLVLSLLHVFFNVGETVTSDGKRTLKSVFDYTLPKKLFDAVTKKREGFDAVLVWCCVAVGVFNIAFLEGNGSISYLFASSTLGWDVSDFSIYAGVNYIIGIIGMLVITKLGATILNISESLVIIISCISSIVSSIAKAFVFLPWHMYFTSVLGCFSIAIAPGNMSIMSKGVPKEDLGKVFSLLMTIQLAMPFAIFPVYVFIYTQTIRTYPSPVWFFAAVLPMIIIILMIFIERRWKV